MSNAFEFFSATDHPALLALGTPELQAAGEAALVELGYKTRAIQSHAQIGCASESSIHCGSRRA